jgi:histidinol-phosphate phosphatase family domain/HAD-superfamily hydrolase, subfamily IIIA
MNFSMSRPAIFLDRDGTINKDCPYCAKKEDINLYGDIFEPLKFLSKYFYIIITTNQSGINRGYFSESSLKEMNEFIKDEISKKGGRIDGIYYCPHRPEENCNCRKPKTGLVMMAMQDFDIDLRNSIVIGNDEKDVGLAKNLGIKSICVRNDNGIHGDFDAKNFEEVVEIIKKLYNLQ